jgi:hypothetical protein
MTITVRELTAPYTLTEENGCWVIRRADGSWLYTLGPEDRGFGEQLIANLNDLKADT